MAHPQSISDIRAMARKSDKSAKPVVFPHAEVGRRIRALREAVQPPLSQIGLGRLVEVGQSTMFRYKTGEMLPGAAVLSRLAEVLNTTERFIVTGQAPLEPSLDRSEADDVPATVDDDVRWAAEQAGLDESETARLASVRRSIGAVSRGELLHDAERIIRGRASISLGALTLTARMTTEDRAQVEPPRPTTGRPLKR